MKKWIFIAAFAATLGGCDPTPEEQASMSASLPAGCSIRDLGSYGDVRHVVVVFCDGRRTSSMSYQQPARKTSLSEATVVFQ